MIEHADQLVLEYLSRANDAAHRSLGARERIDFMARLRQRVEEQRAAAGGATEPAQVRKVLARFGDPEALVRRERRRLDENAGQGTARPPRPAERPEHGPAAIEGELEHGPAAPARRSGAVDLRTLFLRQPMEVGAIALIGIGGLLLPVPLWIFGAVAAALSRVWTTREKILGLGAPMLVAVLAAAASGGIGTLGELGSGGGPPVLRLAGPVGAGLLGERLLRAVGARTVQITRGRARGRPRGR